MSTTRKLTIAIVAIAAISLTILFNRHSTQAPAIQPLHAQAASAGPADTDVRNAISDAKIAVSNLSVRSSAGIVILSGTADAAAAARAVQVARSLGATRVANLITTSQGTDDDTIRRTAERQLASDRALEGCSLTVSCENGILTVSGTIHNELQRDVARQRVRNVSGLQEVRFDLRRV